MIDINLMCGVMKNNMKKVLSNKDIFEDFTNKIMLNDVEKDIIKRYINNQSIVKIADETINGTATVSRIIANVKEKYEDYKRIEIAKLMIFIDKKR